MSNLLIISHEFPPFIGGAGSVAENWVNLLSINHNVTLVTRYNSSRALQKNKYDLIQIKCKRFIFSISYWKVLKKLFTTKSFEYIILNDSGAAQVAALFFNKVQKQKSILIFHGNELEILYPQYIFHLNHLYRFFFKILMHDVNKLVFVSNFLKNKILSKIDKNGDYYFKSHVIYTSIDHKLFYFENHIVNKSKDVSKRLLTVSRIVEKKGLQKIIKILIELRKLNLDFEWVLVGNGPFLNNIKDDLIANNLGEVTKIITDVKRSDLRSYYNNADIFILLSDFEESFGLVYLESNACGVPVIGNNKGGVSEAIVNGLNGILVNNIEEAVESITKWDQLELSQDECIKFSKNFSEEKLLNQINNLLT
jgi:glycosyltransferase involved in cell wall biosynthesis